MKFIFQVSKFISCDFRKTGLNEQPIKLNTMTISGRRNITQGNTALHYIKKQYEF